jgi:hypothetical protein
MFRGREIDLDGLKYVATRDMPAGYLLRSDDFRFEPAVPPGERRLLQPTLDPVGKYLLKGCLNGHAFDVKDLSMAPVINITPGKIKYFFGLQNQMHLANILNTGSHVDICSTVCSIDDAKVASVVCEGSSPSARCFAVLELSKSESDMITAKDKGDYRLVWRSN